MQWSDGVNSGGVSEIQYIKETAAMVVRNARAELQHDWMHVRNFSQIRQISGTWTAAQPSREASWLKRSTPIKRAARIGQAQQRTRVC